MAQWFTDWRDETIGAVPSSISSVWGTPGPEIVSGNVLAGSDRALEITGAGGYQRYGVSWLQGTIDTDSDTTVQLLIEVTGTALPGGILSGSGASIGTRTGYVHWYGSNNRISEYNSGSDSVLASGGTGVSATYRRLEMKRIGDTLDVRYWADGDSRPSTPQATATDAIPRPVAGFVGISCLAGSGSDTFIIHSIGVGTDGDAAPTEPVSATGPDLILGAAGV